jgi:hypothetical protein
MEATISDFGLEIQTEELRGELARMGEKEKQKNVNVREIEIDR